jgi:hypothetical protein
VYVQLLSSLNHLLPLVWASMLLRSLETSSSEAICSAAPRLLERRRLQSPRRAFAWAGQAEPSCLSQVRSRQGRLVGQTEALAGHREATMPPFVLEADATTSSRSTSDPTKSARPEELLRDQAALMSPNAIEGAAFQPTEPRVERGGLLITELRNRHRRLRGKVTRLGLRGLA